MIGAGVKIWTRRADHGTVGDFHLARQPIFDHRAEVVAYELLYRSGPRAGEAGVVDASGATAQVLLSAFSDLGLSEVVGAKSAFINVPWQLLLTEPALPRPAERIVIELLEGAPATPEVVRALERAKAEGYRVALDDFVPHPGAERLLAVADIVKLEVLGVADGDLERQVRELEGHGVELLAEKVETHEQFVRSRELGFTAFQGFFLARPRTLSGRRVPTSLGRIQLLAVLQDPATEPEDLARAISADVGLSYKLLRYVNSAFFSLPRTVSSVRDAVVLLGATGVRRWATLLVLAGVEDQPHELLVTALVRARTCELLSRASGAGDADAYYTTGLFSVVDALMDARLGEVLDALPLDGEVCRALLEHGGAKGAALGAIKAYERGDFDTIAPSLRSEIGSAYLQALRHADEVAAVVA